MSDFDPEQAKQRLRALDDLRNRQIDENPFLLHKLRRGDYDFHVDADWDIRELQKDAESNGYYLYVDLDFEKMQKHYICRQMTAEEWEQYMEWEQEE